MLNWNEELDGGFSVIAVTIKVSNTFSIFTWNDSPMAFVLPNNLSAVSSVNTMLCRPLIAASAFPYLNLNEKTLKNEGSA